jgi:hypothetical protein
MDVKHVERLVEQFELLEISLKDLVEQNQENIKKIKIVQSNGIEVDTLKIKQIVEEIVVGIDKKRDRTIVILKYLIFTNLGFVAGLVFGKIFL